jgi:hypothetical protein
MSAVGKPTLRPERLAALAIAIAAIAGIAVGFFLLPPKTPAIDYIPVLATPAFLGTFCVIGLRQGGRAARWMPLFLMAMFLLQIAGRSHVVVLSALGIGAGAVTIIAALRGHHRLAVVSTIACSALLAATLAGGLLLR